MTLFLLRVVPALLPLESVIATLVEQANKSISLTILAPLTLALMTAFSW